MDAAVADLQQLAINLANASGQGIDKVQTELIRSTANQIRQAAAGMAPRRTGALANSITVVYTGPNRVTIGPTKKYGVYQEFGTGTRGEFPTAAYVIRPRKPGGRLVFQVNGRTVFAKQVTHPGVPPHPFMRPAVEQVVTGMSSQLGDNAVQLIVQKGNQ